jgi:bacterioferritin-associated ferredoxin
MDATTAQPHNPSHAAHSRCGRDCRECPARLICRCIKVDEAAILDALSRHPVRTVKDIRRLTGAGDGCMCCHPKLQRYIDAQAAAQSPVAGVTLPAVAVASGA